MPSITYWNRLEPRARSNDLAGALAARVRDPAWFLARQWQLGEFAGEDAGTPAYVRVAAGVAPMVGWQAQNQTALPLAAGTPLERQTLAEPFSPEDISLWVELGNVLDSTLEAHGALDLRSHWLDAFPIPAAAAETPDDPRSARLRALWKGRVVHGLAVYVASRQPPVPSAPPPGVPATVPSNRWTQASDAVQGLRETVEELYLRGEIASGDPTSWRPDRLDHALSVFAGEPTAQGGVTTAVLEGHPGRDGDLDWFAFDKVTGTVPPGLPAPALTQIARSVIPAPVRFRGMPNERFWDFEDGRVDFGGLRLDRRDLISMVLMEFMLVHGNDWYLVPFEQPIGTLCRSELTVVDVFGVPTTVPRAEEVSPPPSGAKPWTMFSLTGLTNGHLLLASAADVVQDGIPIEEVRFLRDETANLAWAIEHAIESHLGMPWLGHERAAGLEPPFEEGLAAAPLRYRIQTNVPSHWIPFQPVAIPPTSNGQIALEIASLLDPHGSPTTPPVPALPVGRVLRPASIPAATPYRVREEEVPREGTRVARFARVARHSDGSTHLWIARKRTIGAGEGWSGLRFDLALPVTVVGEEPELTTLIWDSPPGWNNADWA